jgi:hypothetical protein
MITKYLILWEDAHTNDLRSVDQALNRLQAKITDAIEKGWEPHGSIGSSTHDSNFWTRFCQPVVVKK